jgi:hypothetical protein
MPLGHNKVGASSTAADKFDPAPGCGRACGAEKPTRTLKRTAGCVGFTDVARTAPKSSSRANDRRSSDATSKVKHAVTRAVSVVTSYPGLLTVAT